MKADDDTPRSGPAGDGQAPSPGGPTVRPGRIPPALLGPHAVTVVRRLQRFGHEAYLVGGCVRDLLAGLEPKDFDVATDAHPARIRRLFRNARIIGRRFRLAHIRFGPEEVVETATFRADPGPAPGADEATDENVFGTAPEDARRRDFTVNALFYDPVADEVVDFVGGLEDLDAGLIRSIGDPHVRLREDPVRMIRAVHFAERLRFRLEPDLERAVAELAGELARASPARLYVELLKVLNRGYARPTLNRLHRLGVLAAWLPEMREVLDRPVDWPTEQGGTHEEARHGEPEDAPTAHAIWNLLGAADRWGLAARGASDALALAPLLGPWVLDVWRRRGGGTFHAFVHMAEEMLKPLALRMSMPRRTGYHLRELLWMLLEMRRPPEGRRAARTMRRPAFAEALALAELDARARDVEDPPCRLWRTRAEEGGVRLDVTATAAGPPRREKQRRSRRGGRRGRRRGGDASRDVAREAVAYDPPPPRPAGGDADATSPPGT